MDLDYCLASTKGFYPKGHVLASTRLSLSSHNAGGQGGLENTGLRHPPTPKHLSVAADGLELHKRYGGRQTDQDQEKTGHVRAGAGVGYQGRWWRELLGPQVEAQGAVPQLPSP